MRVRITDMNRTRKGKPVSYVLETRSDARGNTDRSVFDMVQITGTVVRAGKVIGQPE